MSADKTPSDINSPDRDTSSRDTSLLQGEARKAAQPRRKETDRFDLARMSPKEIAAELARRSQSGAIAATVDPAPAPAKAEPFSHITQAVGPTYEERQRLKEQYVKERYRKDEEMNSHDRAGGFDGAGLSLRDPGGTAGHDGHDLAGWTAPRDDLSAPRSTAQDRVDADRPADGRKPPRRDAGDRAASRAERPSQIERPSRVERYGDDLFADRWTASEADRQPAVQRDRPLEKPERDRPAPSAAPGDIAYAAETPARMPSGQMPAGQMQNGQLQNGQAPARLREQSSHQQWFRDHMLSARPDAAPRIDRPASDDRLADPRRIDSYPTAHVGPTAQVSPAGMRPARDESDYLSLDHTVTDRSSYDEDAPDDRYDRMVDPDTGLAATGSASGAARWADLRADDLHRSDVPRMDLRGRERAGGHAFHAEPSGVEPGHAAWAQPAPRIRWERGIALLLILAALVIGPAIYFYPAIATQWAQLRASNPALASLFGSPPAPAIAAPTAATTQGNPVTGNPAPADTATSGTAAQVPAGNPAPASKATATAEPPAAPMTPLPTTTPPVAAQQPAQPSTPPQASIPAQPAQPAQTTAAAPARPKSTTDFDTAAGVTEVTPQQPLPTQPTTQSQPAGQQLTSSASQGTSEADLKQKSSASATGRKHLSLEPSGAWLKAQPYDPGNTDNDDPSALSNPSTPDAWMKARPYDGGVLTAPGQ